MRYTSLSDSTETAEVWSPGPLDRTVWALRPDGRAVVVHATKLTEVEYQPPEVGLEVSKETVEAAYDILHRHWITDPELSGDRYYHDVILPHTEGMIQIPSDDEVKAAHIVIQLDQRNRAAERMFRAGHISRAAVSDKRLVDLAKGQDDEHL